MKLKLENKTNDEEDPKPRIILPYMGKLTNRLTIFLRRSLECDFGYIPGKKIGQILCNQKDKRDPNPIGIYKIPRSCSSNYIGQTGREITTRIREHKRDVKNKNEKSAVATHKIKNPHHDIKYDSASLIDFEPRYFHRIFKEGLYIQKCQNLMNSDKGMTINPIWTTLLLPTIKPP